MLAHHSVSPLNPLRMSHAATATITFTLPEKLNILVAVRKTLQRTHQGCRQRNLFQIGDLDARSAGKRQHQCRLTLTASLLRLFHYYLQPSAPCSVALVYTEINNFHLKSKAILYSDNKIT